LYKSRDEPAWPPVQIVDRALVGPFTVLCDDLFMGEYQEVLPRPAFGFHAADVDALLDFTEVTGNR